MTPAFEISDLNLQLLEQIAPLIVYSDKGVLIYANSLCRLVLHNQELSKKELSFDRIIVNKKLGDMLSNMEEGSPWWEELLILNGEDKQVWFRAKFIPLRKDKSFVISLVEHQGEEQTESDESTLAAINRNLSEGLYRSTEYGKLIYANHAFVEMFGYDSAAEVKSLATEAFYVEPKKRMELIGSLETGGNFVNKEVLLKRKNGEVFWGLLSTSKSIDQSGQAVYDGALRDITGFKEIERQLKIEKRKAEEASSAKEQFLSTMSHELRTPMNAVIGMTHLLLRDNPLEGQIENLNTLRFSAENLMHIINDILDFSKIEAGKIELEKLPFDLRQLLKNIIESFNPKTDQKGIKLRTQIDEQVPQYLMGDSIRLAQILNNLISNAVKFTYHGEVDLFVEIEEDLPSVIRLKFGVRDTGIGIPPDKLDAIFNLFTQASSSTTRKFGGTGLGLTITKRLVELAGGSLQVESRPGYGSKFFFSISLSKIANQSPESSLKTADYQGVESLEGLRILAAEDNEVNQILLRKFMRLWGAKVSMAENGAEALEMIKEKNYDLILMDIQMPVMDGYTASREIRELEGEYFKNIPIIAVTASALVEVHKRVIDAGMNDFVNKPFSPDQLLNKIVRWVSVSSQ